MNLRDTFDVNPKGDSLEISTSLQKIIKRISNSNEDRIFSEFFDIKV
jgi:hypothetical protein